MSWAKIRTTSGGQGASGKRPLRLISKSGNSLMAAVLTMTLVSPVRTCAAESAAQKCGALSAATNWVETLTEEKERLDTKLSDIAAKLVAVNTRLQLARTRVLQKDTELDAIQKVIQQKQEELDRRMEQKYPDIARLNEERECLMREHAQVVARLSEVNRAVAKTDSVR